MTKMLIAPPTIVLACVFVLLASKAHAANKVDFSRDVLPILSENCFACHGPDAKARKGHLRLDKKEDALRKDDPVIIAGHSGESELIRRVLSSEESEIMPPARSGKKLTTKQVETLKAWVDQGAGWSKHWAFDKPIEPRIPLSKYLAINPIDALVRVRLEKEGLAPAAEAPRETLIRRLYLDLAGLPPAPAEIETFVHDSGPDAYQNLVDRLLASPRFGERMVWDWLEAARYADSNGYQGDNERTMWPWRDWVIQAFNDDMPFDQFTVWQLAGDLLPESARKQKLATGFLRNHAINGEGGRIAEENRIDYVMDMAETTGTVWLGMTFNCCRCHDHKFDAITQKEYYGLFSFFNQTPVTGEGGNPQTPPVLEFASGEEESRLRSARENAQQASEQVTQQESAIFPRKDKKLDFDSAPLKELSKELRDALVQPPLNRKREQLAQLVKHFRAKSPVYADRLQDLGKALSARDDLSRRVPRVMVMEDQPKQRDTFVLEKGLYNKPGVKVTAGVPASLPALPAEAPANRLALARWLVSAENPLTARVIVNRYWQHFFGVGLVKTSEDFGVQGERPSNQELLDWLAVDFMKHGWDLKHLCRQIVTSATYRQSSKMTPASAERDPENRLLARGPRYRMPSWMIRDQALAASGLLAGQMSGPPVHPYQPAGIWEDATFGRKKYQPDTGASLYRRSVYAFWRRIVGPTMFFDSASRAACTVKQTRTNSPLHALSTLNDTTYVEAGRALAERVWASTCADDPGRIDAAFRLVLARFPSAREHSLLQEALDQLRRQFAGDPAAASKLLGVGESRPRGQIPPAEHAAFTALCSMILNLDEALTKE